MATGKIDSVAGNIKLVRGNSSKEEPIDLAKQQNVNIDSSKKLNIRSGGKAKINFLASKGSVAKADIWAKTGSGEYKFPCKLSGGCALKFWANGKGSGCDRLQVKRDYTAKDLPMTTLAAPRTASAQDQAIQEAIKDLIERNIMKGNPNGNTFDEKYRPNDPVTRGQFASLISAANAYWKVPVTDRTRPLSDIANHWAKEAILLAVQTGFMSGYPDGRFEPNQSISRQQALVALVGGLGLPRPEPSAIPDSLQRYQDASKIADWAKPAIRAALQAGLLIDDEATLSPQQAITRGETAILISKTLADKKPTPVTNEDRFTQPPPDPSDPPDQGPQVEIFPMTEEPTLVDIDASDDPGKEAGAIVIRSLTSTVKVVARPSPNSPALESAILQPGQSYLYCIREGKYRGFRTVIEMAERQRIVESPEMQSFLDDWSEEARPLPRAVCEKLFNDLLFRMAPLSQPNLNQEIAQAIDTLGKFSTLPFIAPIRNAKPGENSCGWAVNQVLAQARIESLDTYVPRVKSLLENGRGRKIDPNTEPVQAGDIVIAPVTKGTDGVGEPHMGICISPTRVRSASATGDKNNPPRQFDWETNLNFNGFFDKDAVGTKNSTIYRLNS